MSKQLTEAQTAVLVRMRDGGECMYVSSRGVFVVSRSSFPGEDMDYMSFSARTIQVLREREFITAAPEFKITDAGRAALERKP